MLYFGYITVFWSVCEAELISMSQPASFQAVKVGDTVTVTCHVLHESRVRLWYRLTPERKLQQVASTDMLYNMTTFKEQFQHFSVKSEKKSYDLIISAISIDDVGTYYCGVISIYEVQFGQGTFLMIKGANVISDSIMQHPESQSVQSSDSVTLSCSVQSGQCAAEHTSVMWLKSSHHSAPEMIYSSGDESSSCQKSETGPTTCVYNLLLRELSSDDAGTYYCVVTACGQVLTGNGTRIKIHSNSSLDTSLSDVSPTVIALTLSNVVFMLMTLLLTWRLCKNKKKPTTSSRSSGGSSEDDRAGDEVTYTAVSHAPKTSSHRSAAQKHSEEMVVYSDVRSK